MKRLICFFLLLSLALSLCACADANEVTYYYVRNETQYLYGTAEGVMVPEHRSAAGHTDDLRYLLIMYLHGPVTDYLECPFPNGTALDEFTLEDGHLNIKLSGIVSMMKAPDLTLACACLARTCFGITDAETVTIHAESLNAVSMTFTRDSWILVDDSAKTLTDAE